MPRLDITLHSERVVRLAEIGHRRVVSERTRQHEQAAAQAQTNFGGRRWRDLVRYTVAKEIPRE